MPNLHSKQVALWTELQENILSAELTADTIEWTENHEGECGKDGIYIRCTLTPKERTFGAIPFAGTRAEFNNLIHFIKWLRAGPREPIQVEATVLPVDKIAFLPAGCAVCNTSLASAEVVNARRGADKGYLAHCLNCHSLSFVTRKDRQVWRIVGVTDHDLAHRFYRLGGSDPDEQGTTDDQRE